MIKLVSAISCIRFLVIFDLSTMVNDIKNTIWENIFGSLFSIRVANPKDFFCLWGDLVEKVVATQILFTPNPVEMIPFDGSRLFPNGLVETT